MEILTLKTKTQLLELQTILGNLCMLVIIQFILWTQLIIHLLHCLMILLQTL